MKTYGGVDIWIHVFLTSALVVCEWSDSRFGRFTPGERAPVPIGWEFGCASEPVWTTWRRERCCPYRDSNTDPSTVQPVASRYYQVFRIHRMCAVTEHANQIAVYSNVLWEWYTALMMIYDTVHFGTVISSHVGPAYSAWVLRGQADQ
jgi:hypothetical protein